MTRHLYISPASDVVHDRHFENGVVKVQRREERTLFSAEKAALAYSKIDAGATIVDDEEVYFINRVYAVKKAKTTAFRYFNHVKLRGPLVQPNLLKLIMTSHRFCINPSTIHTYWKHFLLYILL